MQHESMPWWPSRITQVDQDSATADKTNELQQDHVRVHHQASNLLFLDFADYLLLELVSLLLLPMLTFGSDVVGVDDHDYELLR